jgi:hypothetical protein
MSLAPGPVLVGFAHVHDGDPSTRGQALVSDLDVGLLSGSPRFGGHLSRSS